MYEKNNDILKDGVRIVTLSSWEEFHQEVRNLKSTRGYVWRGQRKDEVSGWPLESSFDRKVKQDHTQKLKKHLDNFKEAMNKCHPNVLPPDDIGIWALGQHYGLKTPLIDWTLSPYIAAYFAFERVNQNNEDDKYRYVYALNRSIERLLSKRKKAKQVLSSGRSVPFIDKLPHPNLRFTAQKGIFTKAFRGSDIFKYVQSFSRKRPNEVILVKFRIPTKDREKCLCELQLMHIDRASLLLDFRAVVDECNSELN